MFEKHRITLTLTAEVNHLYWGLSRILLTRSNRCGELYVTQLSPERSPGGGEEHIHIHTSMVMVLHILQVSVVRYIGKVLKRKWMKYQTAYINVGYKKGRGKNWRNIYMLIYFSKALFIQN